MIVLVRVDDRLIHGQVVIAWGQAVSPDLYILADDEIAAETDDHDIFRAGVPSGQNIRFLSVEEAGAAVSELRASTERVVILISDIDSLIRLCNYAPSLESVNLGGVHEATGRRQRLPYLYLSDAETSALAALEARGVAVIAQDVPTAAAVELGDLL